MGGRPSIEGMWLQEHAEPVVDVAQLRARDVDAWETLFDRMYPRMLAYAERRVDSADDAVTPSRSPSPEWCRASIGLMQPR